MQKLKIAADNEDQQTAMRFAENLAKLIVRKYPSFELKGAPEVEIKRVVEIVIPVTSKDNFLNRNVVESAFWVQLDMNDIKSYISEASSHNRLNGVHWSFKLSGGGRNGWKVETFTWKMI